MVRLYGAFVDRWVPAGIEEDPEDHRRARLVVQFCGIVAAAGIGYGLVYAALGMMVAMLGAFSAAVLAAMTLIAHHRWGNVRLAGHALGLTTLVALVPITANTGGLDSPANAWLVLSGLLPGMLAGRWAAAGWGAAATAWVAVQYGVYLGGGHFVDELPSRAWVAFFQAIVGAGIVGCVAALAWIYEQGREEAQARLDRVQGELVTAHSASREILDSIAEGLLMVSPSGRLEPSYSKAVVELVGEPRDGQHLWGLFLTRAPVFAEWLELAWSDLDGGFLPTEVILAQLPSRVELDGRDVALSYAPQYLDGELERVLVTIRDVSAQVSAEREAEGQREQLGVFLAMLRDGSGTRSFFAEASELVAHVVAGSGTRVQERRWLHTLKGNCATFGLHSVARRVHELEDREEEHGLWEDDRDELRTLWSDTMERLHDVLGSNEADVVTVDRAALDATVAMAEGGVSGHRIAACMRSWTWRRVDLQLDQLADRTRELALRLGLDHVDVEVESEPLRVPPTTAWTALFSTMVHAVRNALDHGVELPDERVQAQKAERARVCLAARRVDGDLVLEICDDGRGVDWSRVRERAEERGLPASSREDLVKALFADGLTTRDAVTELSGRGVGTAALLECVERLGGQVQVESERGCGTTIRCVLPQGETLEEVA